VNNGERRRISVRIVRAGDHSIVHVGADSEIIEGVAGRGNETEERMGCLFAIFAGFFPRLAVLFIWLARPAAFSAAFGGNWLWPILGVIFLPFTTLMYLLLWSPGVGLTGLDWLWLVLAAFLDLGGIGSTGYANRARLPASRRV
jgi:hypothetical protein